MTARMIEEYLSAMPSWLAVVLMLAAAVLAGVLAQRLLFALATRISRRTPTALDDLFVRHAARPMGLLLPLLFVSAVWGSAPIAPSAAAFGQLALSIALIATGAWLLVALLGAMVAWSEMHFRVDVGDNLQARRVQTQVGVLRRTANVLIIVVAAALMLLKIPGVENVGASLLASAGLAGIIVGMAARPAVANVLAGLQLALTQPIRLDDVVIVEGEWGRIEEISTTFVVIRIWDLRRLVVPLSYFIEKPFQNWTRVTADLLGTVFVHADYTTPIEDVRRELHHILETSGMWDGKVWNLQVTDTTERTIELRALMSASDASTAWDLRCHVRERLIAYLQEHHPRSLPHGRTRIEAIVEGGGVAKTEGVTAVVKPIK
jgi:small-conductance mechanosensitive channel